jgi:hypothetical protein
MLYAFLISPIRISYFRHLFLKDKTDIDAYLRLSVKYMFYVGNSVQLHISLLIFFCNNILFEMLRKFGI